MDTIPTEIYLKLSPELAEFTAHLINAIIFHGAGIALCTLSNWVPNKVTKR
jgi:hypothetical protein